MEENINSKETGILKNITLVNKEDIIESNRIVNKKDIGKFCERFWRKVDRKGIDDCWPWIAGTTGRGDYGKIKYNDIVFNAHRISWILIYGDIPIGMSVLHRCDNGLCQNPNHLFLGTQYDNIQDRTKKDRSFKPKGEKNVKVKLSKDQVNEIRKRYNNGESSKDLGKEYDVTTNQILLIIDNKCWTDETYTRKRFDISIFDQITINYHNNGKYGIIRTREKRYDPKYDLWQLHIDAEQIIQFDNMILYCLGQTKENIRRVYIFPRDEVIKRKRTISIYNNPLRYVWYSNYRVDEKPYNEIYRNFIIKKGV